MLRKLVRTPLRLVLQTQKTNRMTELKEYVCLRESLNDQASQQAAKDFQDICSKYNLSPEDLTALFKVINSDPQLLKNHVSYEAWLQSNEALKYEWRKSPFFTSGQNLESTAAKLRKQYPDVVNFEGNQPERVNAYHTLENIFLRDGPKLRHANDNAAVARFLPEFEKRINGHINELKNKNPSKSVDAQGVHSAAISGETDALTEIAKCLGTVYAKLQEHPAYVYGSIRHFIAVHKQNLGELEARESTQAKPTKSLEERAVSRLRSEQTEDLEDVPAIIEEENKALRKSLGYNFLPWLNDRKLIFEAQADRGNTLLYGALGGVLGAYFLFKLYQGDATYLGLFTVAAGAAFCSHRFTAAKTRNNLKYLVQMNIHRDGRTLDLFVQRGGNEVSKIEGVPISDFKLHRGNYDFGLQEDEATLQTKRELFGEPTNKLSDWRASGVGRGHWVATYGDEYIFVPMNYQGNSAILKQVFKGENAEV